MACSCPSSNVGPDYIKPTVPQFVADLPSGLAVETMIDLATLTAVDGGVVLGDLLVSLTGVCRP
ncbi:hypothetical protein D3C78_1648220 [compost metagenome]